VDERAASVNQAVCGKCGEKLPPINAAAANGKPQVVTDSTFANEVLNASASVPVLMDCWAHGAARAE